MNDWRERKKAATRQRIQDAAIELFLVKGYEATTVEEIAAAAGVSHMTFFRYFPAKDLVVTADPYDPMIAELVAARPAEEPPLLRLRRALAEGFTYLEERELATVRARARLILDTPALRAQLWQQERDTAELVATALAGGVPDLRFRVLAGAGMAAMTAAVVQWAGDDETASLAELIDRAFQALT
ncbi:acyl-CoA-like ligand-binding transcription factor [Sphaerisporangium corydalis]|uniref:TetR family transcriptional regulator n=1 Tax=Sphaerisporangium corydalis TaxID=1441875 RepID=A0ABV9ENQ8_9ACTN|nr:TetR family transcriptional regulator [Sphaerisporangium corydalis]